MTTILVSVIAIFTIIRYCLVDTLKMYLATTLVVDTCSAFLLLGKCHFLLCTSLHKPLSTAFFIPILSYSGIRGTLSKQLCTVTR